MRQSTFTYFALILLVSGCAPSRIPVLQEQPKAQKIDQAPQQQHKQKAIKPPRTKQKQGHSKQLVEDARPQAINDLLAQAERHLKRKEHPEAGQLYRKASISFPTDSTLANAVDMTPAQLKSRINDCADQLLELGLLAYRKGELRQAVGIWDQISGFHSEHRASQRALATTRLQLKNLAELLSN
jgi:tetratricopeptide (TPR) repeat protein